MTRRRAFTKLRDSKHTEDLCVNQQQRSTQIQGTMLTSENNSMDMDMNLDASAVVIASTKKPGKRVRWGTITALEFCIGHSACSVPGSAGPPIGLTGSPIRYTVSSIIESPTSLNLESRAESNGIVPHKRSSQDYWLCPMERVQILANEEKRSLDEITAICSDVSALLEARAISKFDHVAHHILESLQMSRHDDLRKLRQTFHHDNRKKIVLF